MQDIAIVKNYLKARYTFFKWRYNLAAVNKVTLAFGIACITGLAAQIKISLPWTPVPITAQTLTVLLSGVLLGRWYGGISQAIYVIMGACGVPWFSGWSGGYQALFGPTGGYLIGFIFASLFLGHFTDKYIRARGFLPMLGLMIFANFLLIHIPGLLQLKLWLYLFKLELPTFKELLLMGSIPFVFGDMTKIFIAAMIAKIITPKEAYNGEKDATKK